jgi:hypothetical protein
MSYECLVKMRTNALNRAEKAFAMGLVQSAIRYYKFMNKIEGDMWNFSSVNSLIK